MNSFEISGLVSQMVVSTMNIYIASRFTNVGGEDSTFTVFTKDGTGLQEYDKPVKVSKQRIKRSGILYVNK
jgi:hypothetical protein